MYRLVVLSIGVWLCNSAHAAMRNLRRDAAVELCEGLRICGRRR